MNKHHFVAIGLAVASTFATPLLAQETCGKHTVVSGDTLRSIAKETYGNAKDYRYIFDANRAKFGISPHVIRIGQNLDLPCRGIFIASEIADPVVEVALPIIETETAKAHRG